MRSIENNAKDNLEVLQRIFNLLKGENRTKEKGG